MRPLLQLPWILWGILFVSLVSIAPRDRSVKLDNLQTSRRTEALAVMRLDAFLPRGPMATFLHSNQAAILSCNALLNATPTANANWRYRRRQAAAAAECLSSKSGMKTVHRHGPLSRVGL
ncbi:hypothetical protein C8R46DRAFT_1047377 [Mycena filopes]|nr:hypothetical protein C8R46DRAFT_1047377 [Mycena filopes]